MGFTDLFKKMFPFITVAAGAVGGPLGSMAASALGKALGADVKTEDLTNKIQELSMTEEGRLKLEAAENDFKLAMAKLGYDDAETLAKTAADDRASARNREITLKDRIPALLAIMVTLGFFGVLAFMLFRQVPATGHDALLLMLGALGSAWTAVVAYYFGSSAGSDRKTELMANGTGAAR